MESPLEFGVLLPLLGVNLTRDCLSFLEVCLFDKYVFGNSGYRYLLTDQFLDFMDIILFCRITERNGITCLVCPTCATDTVHIIFDDNGYVKIDNVAHVADI